MKERIQSFEPINPGLKSHSHDAIVTTIAAKLWCEQSY